MFALHAFITSDQDAYPLAILETALSTLLAGQDDIGPEVSYSTLPFSNQPRLLYRWPTWNFSVTSDQGEQVAADADFVAQTCGAVFPGGRPTHRIRVVFAQDSSRDFTNHIIWIMDWLKEIPGVVLYDETSKSLC